MTGGDLGKTDLSGHVGNLGFVNGVEIGVQSGNGDGTDAVIIRGLKDGARCRFIKRVQNSAIRIQTLVYFFDTFIQKLGAFDFQIEQAGASLIADFQKVAEAFGDQQQHPLAFAFQKRVGGDRGAHFDGTDRIVRQRIVCPDQFADALNSGVPVPFGVFGKKLVRHQRPIRFARNHICKCAAAINPEFPLPAHVLPLFAC